MQVTACFSVSAVETAPGQMAVGGLGGVSGTGWALR